MTNVRVKTALLSVSDKSDLLPFVETLVRHDVNLLSTGGTHRLIKDAGIAIREVSDYTSSPEMMDGRVKTLHPKIHGGLLGRRGTDEVVMNQHDIEEIDLLVVNLYPFQQAIADRPEDLPNAIENIDIGGPAMLRSAAKNFESVAVLTDIKDYSAVADELNNSGGYLSRETRFRLSTKAFQLVAQYDAAISNYLSGVDLDGGRKSEYPDTLTLQFHRRDEMRYGENPHQSAAFFVEENAAAHTISNAVKAPG